MNYILERVEVTIQEIVTIRKEEELVPTYTHFYLRQSDTCKRGITRKSAAEMSLENLPIDLRTRWECFKEDIEKWANEEEECKKRKSSS